MDLLSTKLFAAAAGAGGDFKNWVLKIDNTIFHDLQVDDNNNIAVGLVDRTTSTHRGVVARISEDGSTVSWARDLGFNQSDFGMLAATNRFGNGGPKVGIDTFNDHLYVTSQDTNFDAKFLKYDWNTGNVLWSSNPTLAAPASPGYAVAVNGINTGTLSANQNSTFYWTGYSADSSNSNSSFVRSLFYSNGNPPFSYEYSSFNGFVSKPSSSADFWLTGQRSISLWQGEQASRQTLFLGIFDQTAKLLEVKYQLGSTATDLRSYGNSLGLNAAKNQVILAGTRTDLWQPMVIVVNVNPFGTPSLTQVWQKRISLSGTPSSHVSGAYSNGIAVEYDSNNKGWLGIHWNEQSTLTQFDISTLSPVTHFVRHLTPNSTNTCFINFLRRTSDNCIIAGITLSAASTQGGDSYILKFDASDPTAMYGTYDDLVFEDISNQGVTLAFNNTTDISDGQLTTAWNTNTHFSVTNVADGSSTTNLSTTKY